MNRNLIVIILFILGVIYFVSPQIGTVSEEQLNQVRSMSTEEVGVIEPEIKSQLDGYAMDMLIEAENHTEENKGYYIQEMVKLGVTHMTPPTVYAKQTPNCPPIEMELNGENLSGELCARMSYRYARKDYWVGYCR